MHPNKSLVDAGVRLLIGICLRMACLVDRASASDSTRSDFVCLRTFSGESVGF